MSDEPVEETSAEMPETPETPEQDPGHALESAESASSEPESTEPESAEPESTEPESTEPESAEPESPEPADTGVIEAELVDEEPVDEEPVEEEPTESLVPVAEPNAPTAAHAGDDTAEPRDDSDAPAVAAPEVLAALAAPAHEGAKPRLSAKAVALLAGRASAGILVTAVAVVVAVGSTFITPAPITSTAPKPIVATPVPAAEQLVCPGGLLRLADSSGADASKVSPLGAPATAWASDGDVTTRNVGTTNAGAAGTLALAEIGTVAPAGGAAPVASGLQSQLLLGDTRGLATASCAAPRSDEWLVGGATTLGRTSFVVITNASDVEADVELEVYGPEGEVLASGTSGIRLAPDEQRVVPLNGLAVDLDAPVVHVTSTGGRVVASLEQTITRTLVPGGADWSGAQQPSERLVIPGVHVTDATALTPIDVSETDHADVTPVARLLAPLDAADDTTPVTATIAWIPDGSTLADALAARDTSAQGDGSSDDQGPTDADVPAGGVPAAPRSMDVTLTPGVTAELPVSGLGVGDYTVVVIASKPVVGGVRASTIADSALPDAALAGGVDFAWFQPAAALGDDAVVSIPDLASDEPSAAAEATALASTLWIANPTDSAATVTVTPDGGSAQTLDLAPGTAAHVDLAAGKAVRLAGVGGLSASVVTGGPGLLAQSPLEPPPPSASPVNVHL